MAGLLKRITQTEVRALYDEVEAIKKQAEASVARLNTLAATYEQSVNTISTSLEQAKQSASSSNEAKVAAGGNAEELRKLLSEAKQHHESVAEFSRSVDVLSERVSKTEEKMTKLSAEALALRKQVEELLPGATSAGLASAFRERKESFQGPVKLWARVFIGSLVALLVVAFLNPVDFTIDKVTLENFHMYVLLRLPFLVPIVWLAIYAAHKHNQALRLEEEYAHKEAISKSFEGYKTQLLEIESDSTSTAAEHLVNRTLEALARHPGRIYDAKREDLSPFGVIKEWFTFGAKESPKKEDGAEKA
ncbi:MAG: hypothetical protein ACOY33_09375 [Pseudomonadota bacterium]